MWTIKKSIIEDCVNSAQNVFPKEFLCFLGGNKKDQTIDEIVFLPSISGESFATINLTNMPNDTSIIGSLHSHPNGVARPSLADKRFFTRYYINIILGVNSNTNQTYSISAFDTKATSLELKLTD